MQQDKGAAAYRRYCEQGEESALADLIRAYKDGLTFYLNSVVGDLSLAEELTEDTFVLLGTKKPRDKGTASFKTWLYTIARHLAVDALRRRARRPALSLEECGDPADAADFERAFLQKEERVALHRALAALPSDPRQALYLRYFEELSAAEIARVMRRSPHAVETLLYRARLLLKDELIKEGLSDEDL